MGQEINMKSLYSKQEKMIKHLTKLNKVGIPILKNPLHQERAINLLYNYENTGLSPNEIINLKIQIEALQERIKRFEQWE